MKTKIYLLAIMLLSQITISLNAQTPNWIWAHQALGNGWNIGYEVATDANDNSYVCGFFMDSTTIGNQHLYSSFQRRYVAKYDSNGIFQWVTVFLGDHWTFAEKITLDSQNNIIGIGV